VVKNLKPGFIQVLMGFGVLFPKISVDWCTKAKKNSIFVSESNL